MMDPLDGVPEPNAGSSFWAALGVSWYNNMEGCPYGAVPVA